MVKKALTIGYADLETEHIGDLNARGIDVVIDGNVLRTQNGDIPTIGIKCCGMIVRTPDGQETEFMYHSIPEFLQGLYDNRVDRCYFYNLKFDDSFIASFMHNDIVELDGCIAYSKGRLISHMGQVYSDTIAFEGGRDAKTHRKDRKCDLWDAAKIWAGGLDALGKSFGVIKGGTTGGSKAMEVGCSREMEEYCLQDCRVMMTAMEYYFTRCRAESHGKRPYGWMTAASTAYNLCMMHVKQVMTTKGFRYAFPAVTEENGFPAWEREGYKGAVPLLDPAIRNKPLKNVDVFDINSQYPDKLRNYPMPIGRAIKIVDADMDKLMTLKAKGKLWVAKLKMVADVKAGHRATYLLKRKNADGETLAWHINDLEGTNLNGESFQVVTSADMDYILRDYDVRYVEVLDAVGFEPDRNHVLSGFIDKWYAIKEEASARKDKPMKAFAKLILNALYGKFGANPVHISAEYVFDGDMIRVKECEGVETDESPLYLPIAMFTTAYARDVISKTCNAIGWEHVAYTDTDSVHVHGLTTEETKRRIGLAGYKIHPTELGAYDYESRWTDALYVRNKGYFHFGGIDTETGEPNGENEIKMAGANGFDGLNSMDDVLDKELKGTQKRGYRVNGGIMFMMKDVAIDTRMDACIKHRLTVKGMNTEQGMIEIARREEEIWKVWE